MPVITCNVYVDIICKWYALQNNYKLKNNYIICPALYIVVIGYKIQFDGNKKKYFNF